MKSRKGSWQLHVTRVHAARIASPGKLSKGLQVGNSCEGPEGRAEDKGPPGSSAGPPEASKIKSPVGPLGPDLEEEIKKCGTRKGGCS